MARLRATVTPLSPRHRRWKRFLAELPLDPSQLSLPVEEPGPQDFVICGVPRTGTTLLAAALFQPPTVVTVTEPWDGMRLPPADLFRSLRAEIETTGELRRGRLDVEALLAEGTTRRCLEGTSVPKVETAAGYLMGVKWPAYWRYMELLPSTKFLFCTRHPFETMASFKKAGTQLLAGLEYETPFNRELNEHLLAATTDPRVRRVLFYDHVHERVAPFLSRPNVLVVRYERWFDDPRSLLHDLATFLGVPLRDPPVRIRRPSGPPRLGGDEVAVIRERCQVAGWLGYPLGGGVDGEDGRP